jgi:hypothetical protein
MVPLTQPLPASAMYQLEVKANLVAAAFPPSKGWTVCVDIDAMERCNGGIHPVGKLERVVAAENRLRTLGARIGAHRELGRVDVVAIHPEHGTVVVEVEGSSSRQREQAMYSSFAQIALMMHEDDTAVSYALAVPDEPTWERHLRKIPHRVALLLRLHLYLVSEFGVRELKR